MEQTMTKMPWGAFGVDAETMEIVREEKAPYRPIIKMKDAEPAFTPAANQAASVATDAAGLVTDFNALLTKLKAAGLMEADAT